jgi:hypothetical protein
MCIFTDVLLSFPASGGKSKPPAMRAIVDSEGKPMAKGLGKKEPTGMERRRYFRYQLIYSPKDAKLTIGDHDYLVLDFSVDGLRFKIDDDFPFGREIRGTITFSDDESRDIEATIVWMQDNEIGLKFKETPDNT